MAIIGTFTRGTNGNFSGSIKTLTLSMKLQFAVEADKTRDNAPDYRVFLGTTEVGAAWKRTGRESGREYWSVKLDDPAFATPIYASLFEAEDGQHFHLLWSRRNGD